MAAVRALETGEAGGEVAATEEGLDGGDGVGAEWAEGLAVLLFVVCEEIVPAVVDDLTSSMRIGFAFRAPLIAAWHCQSGEARGRRG